MSYFITLVVCEQLQLIRGADAVREREGASLYAARDTRPGTGSGPRVWKPDGDGGADVCSATGTVTVTALLAVTAVRESRRFLQGAAASPGAHRGSPTLLLPHMCGLDPQLPACSQMEGIGCGTVPPKDVSTSWPPESVNRTVSGNRVCADGME